MNMTRIDITNGYIVSEDNSGVTKENDAHRLDPVKLVKFCPDNDAFVRRRSF